MVHGLWVCCFLLVGCSQSASDAFVHFGGSLKVVNDTDFVEPDIDYLAEYKKLSGESISSFQTYEVGDSTMEFPIAADNFVGLKYIQQAIIRQLMGPDYVGDYIQDAVKRYEQDHPDKVNRLSLHTCYNKDNLYACRNQRRLMIFNVTSGVQLHLRDLFQGDYYDAFLEAMNEDKNVNLGNFTICDQGLLFETVDDEGDPKQLLVGKDVARPYLTDKWHHIWR